MLSYIERKKMMEGKSAEELFKIGLGFFAEGEEWEAEEWYKAAMEGGNADAAFALARINESLYMNKVLESQEITLESIIDLYKKASELGHKNAGIFLGNLYLASLSGEEDPTDDDYNLVDKALDAYCSARDNGNKEAYYYIAQLYESGYLDNMGTMFSGNNYLEGAKADSYGGYMGLYQMAMVYGWDYIPLDKDLVISKLNELSPYPPENEGQ